MLVAGAVVTQKTAEIMLLVAAALVATAAVEMVVLLEMEEVLLAPTELMDLAAAVAVVKAERNHPSRWPDTKICFR